MAGSAQPSRLLARAALVAPVVAFAVMLATFGRELPWWAAAIVVVSLVAAILAAVHHAEVVAHRVGEPYGSLILAVAVTVIEVALIVTLMISGGGNASSLARDTVFSAVMITCNGIVGLVLLLGAMKTRTTRFHAEGTGTALATVATLSVLALVLPSVTTSAPGPQFSPFQLAFAAVASLVVYLAFVSMQTVRHRDYFLPTRADGTQAGEDEHADPPSAASAVRSLILLLVALIAVVGCAKAISPAIESGVASAGLPGSVVGVVIALLVLLPETLAAARAARRDRVQIGLNLGYGSAMASIGLTIPVIAVASIWLPGPLILGLGPAHLVLLGLTFVVSTLTVVPGRATLLQGGLHLTVFAAFLVLAVSP